MSTWLMTLSALSLLVVAGSRMDGPSMVLDDAPPAIPPGPAEVPRRMVTEDDSADALVTLWAKDDLRNTFSLSTGRYASHVERGELRLDDAHLAFGVFEEGKVTVGFTRDARTEVLDLGTIRVAGASDPGDLAPAVEMDAFNTMRLHRGRLTFVGPLDRRVFVADGEDLIAGLPGEGARAFTPEVGHIYLIRLMPRGFKEKADHLAILEPIDFDAGRRLTFRWALLR